MSTAELWDEDVLIPCPDGVKLVARIFHPPQQMMEDERAVIVAPATGVEGRYYWPFAGYLAENGFHVLVPDYRGIGRSAPSSRRGYRHADARWHEWGTLDLESCILWLRVRHAGARLMAVGHSFGGFAVILAEHATALECLMMVGAQHAHWPDYAPRERLKLFLRWHLVMPILTVLWGYFPGKKLGWLENLPRHVALDWARASAHYAKTIGHEGSKIMGRAAELTLPVFAVNPTDDPYATPAAVRRTLSYLPRADVCELYVDPSRLGHDSIGHFGLFRPRFKTTFWQRALEWLTSSGDHRCAEE